MHTYSQWRIKRKLGKFFVYLAAFLGALAWGTEFTKFQMFWFIYIYEEKYNLI